MRNNLKPPVRVIPIKNHNFETLDINYETERLNRLTAWKAYRNTPQTIDFQLDDRLTARNACQRHQSRSHSHRRKNKSVICDEGFEFADDFLKKKTICPPECKTIERRQEPPRILSLPRPKYIEIECEQPKSPQLNLSKFLLIKSPSIQAQKRHINQRRSTRRWPTTDTQRRDYVKVRDRRLQKTSNDLDEKIAGWQQTEPCVPKFQIHDYAINFRSSRINPLKD